MNFRLPFLCAFMLILSSPSPNAAETLNSYSEAFLSGVNQFSNHFYKTLAKNNDGNFISSPVSALTVLAMLAEGADGNSREELIRAIHLPITQENILENYRQFLLHLSSVSGVELHLANKLFVHNVYPISPSFQNVTEYIFQSKTEKINFSDMSGAAELINKWSEEHTNNKIKDLVKPDDLEKTVIMMLNAVYFKGSWVHSFGSELKNKVFFLSRDNSVSVPFMCNIAKYNHGILLNSTARYVELPYEVNDSTNEFSMYVIVPNDINGLATIGNNLHEVNFAALNFPANKRNFTLCMPKFKIESDLDLIPTLQDMGVHDVFGKDANLSNIGPDDRLEVTQVVQKAFLSVDENGSEAAVTTAINISERSMRLQLEVDRPFIAAIVSKASGVPLFWARVNDPRV